MILEDFFENNNERGELQHKVRQRWRTLQLAQLLYLCLSQPFILQTKSFGNFLFTLNDALLLFWDLVGMVVR